MIKTKKHPGILRERVPGGCFRVLPPGPLGQFMDDAAHALGISGLEALRDNVVMRQVDDFNAWHSNSFFGCVEIVANHSFFEHVRSNGFTRSGSNVKISPDNSFPLHIRSGGITRSSSL